MLTLIGTIVEINEIFMTKDGPIQKVAVEYDYRYNDDFKNDIAIIQAKNNDVVLESISHLRAGDMIKAKIEIDAYKASDDMYFPNLNILDIQPTDRRVLSEFVLECKALLMPPTSPRVGHDGTEWHTGRIIVEHTDENGRKAEFMIEGTTPYRNKWANKFNSLEVGDTLVFNIYFKTLTARKTGNKFMKISIISFDLAERVKQKKEEYTKDDILAEFDENDLDNIDDTDDLPF